MTKAALMKRTTESSSGRTKQIETEWRRWLKSFCTLRLDFLQKNRESDHSRGFLGVEGGGERVRRIGLYKEPKQSLTHNTNTAWLFSALSVHFLSLPLSHTQTPAAVRAG